jgi:hypothetical protein
MQAVLRRTRRETGRKTAAKDGKKRYLWRNAPASRLGAAKAVGEAERRSRNGGEEREEQHGSGRTTTQRKGRKAGRQRHSSNEGFQRPSLTRRHPAAPKGSSGRPATGCSPWAWLWGSPDGPVSLRRKEGAGERGWPAGVGVTTGPHPFKFSNFKQGTSPQETEGVRERVREREQ